jgi:hypothetical protein
MTLVNVKWEITCDVWNAGMYVTGHANSLGKHFSHGHPSNWRNESYWVFGTNHWAINCPAGVKTTSLNQNYDINPGDRIPMGFDSGAQVPGGPHNSVTIDLSIAGNLVKSHTFGSETYNFTYYQVDGREIPTPSYLETLDKLDQWSSAQYIPNSRNQLNL